MKKPLIITKEKKIELVEKLLLYKVGVEDRKFSILFAGEDKPLETPFTSMMAKELVTIENESTFVLTEKGKEVLKKFQNHYNQYIRNYDIYCAVDLEKGEFAFASYEDFEEDEEEKWQAFLATPRFSDLRIPVAAYQEEEEIAEMIFLFLIHDGRFEEENQKKGWQFDLVLGSLWKEIENIYQKSIDYHDLGYLDEDEEITYQDVMEDIIDQGEELLEKIHNK